MTRTSIVGECDKCGNEDSIDCFTGLCPSCTDKTIDKTDKLKIIESIEILLNRLETDELLNNKHLPQIWEGLEEIERDIQKTK